ncbi:MAG: class I SAM-dependent methyltransferase [Candidatus Brockarchaeota archaeon]|nr:class I SAM-dependent methyltransferase [Candidatus Brockarchaeota archaeon]MBO3842544.1 class I SAM-dependent methyltransferase [Candidatus Brockarchaeota archaeon]
MISKPFEDDARLNDENRVSIAARMLSEYPFSPSPVQVVDAALELAEPCFKDVLVDLGCGDGTVLVRAAGRFRVFSVGLELDARLVEKARRRVREAGLSHMVDIVNADLFQVDLSRFSLVYVYPFPPVVRRLSLKILDECRRGTRILVHDHPLEKMEPLKTLALPSGGQHVHTILLYVL